MLNVKECLEDKKEQNDRLALEIIKYLDENCEKITEENEIAGLIQESISKVAENNNISTDEVEGSILFVGLLSILYKTVENIMCSY